MQWTRRTAFTFASAYVNLSMVSSSVFHASTVDTSKKLLDKGQLKSLKLRTIFGQVPTRMKSRGGIEMDEACTSYALQSRPTRRTCNKALCSQITKFKVIKIWNKAHASMQG